MKKITLLLLLFCAIPVAALWEGGRQLPGDKAASGIALLLPPAETDFSDLDVRDAQNRRISTPSARQALENLFRENLLDLTIFAAPHSITQIYNWLDTFSHLFNKSIYTRLITFFGLFQEAILPPTKRFVHNVHNLWITLFVPLLICSSIFASRNSIRSPDIIHLRC
jgi:hypothetical protein